ncbi:hypothetical protein FRC07_003608 [Ceratobasidium sp. 392]|nr:hypothetical protein FRC07_003608 [Ceratobasidium sp. 392]
MAQPDMSQKGVRNYGTIESDTPLPAYYVTPAPPPRPSFTSSRSRFEVVTVESDKKQIVVEVEVTKDPKGIARVCALPSTGDSETYGVGFYAPRLHDPHEREYYPAFKVLVYIPTGSSQQNLNAFETRLGQFEHVFPDLTKINFSRLQTSAANVPMTFASVVATSVHVTNANGPIYGALTSATDLIVSNANGKIEGEYTLTQAGNIKLDNANAPTSAQIRLKSGDFHPRPDYHLTASNANGPIDLSILEQPVGSGFFLKASNAMSAVRVHLNSAFEGAFKLSTVFNRPTVEVRNSKEDPAGRGRERFVQFDKRGSTTSGRAGWGSPNDAKEHAPGNVVMDTVSGPMELFFD